jgi:ketosteroid isomerase-like protein
MEKNNKEVILEWIEKKFQNPQDYLDADVVLVIPGPSNDRIFGQHIGIKAFPEVLKAIGEKVNQRFEVRSCIAEGNEVVVILEETLTPKAQGSKEYLNHSAWLFRLNNLQKITYLYTYDDTLVTSEALA